MSVNSLLHLAVALDGAGWHPAAWREPEARAGELLSADRWLDLLRLAEQALLDCVTIEDSHKLHQTLPAGVVEHRTDLVRGRLDAIMIAARLAPRSRGIGIVPAAATTLTEPFLLGSQIATLDFISHGRAGWLAQVPDLPGDGGYVGPRAVVSGEAAWAEAAEHVEIVRRLWDSWDDDAEIRDVETHRFFDRERVHHIDFQGTHLTVKGPSITPRPPQGQPVIAITVDAAHSVHGAAHAANAIAVAAASADVIFLRAADTSQLATVQAAVGQALAVAGRDRADVRVLADVAVVLDHDVAVDAGGVPGMLTFVGAPAGLAEQLIAWQHDLGVDGFRLWPASLPHDLVMIARQLSGELRQRGRFRASYEAGTLRGLFGLERPLSRYRDGEPADRDPLAGGIR